MTTNKKWPKWIELRYYKQDSNAIMGYTGNAPNANILFQMFKKLNVSHSEIITFHINGKLANEEEKTDFYKWLNKTEKEIEIHEESKKTN